MRPFQAIPTAWIEGVDRLLVAEGLLNDNPVPERLYTPDGRLPT
ncbi:hypothetical protein [Streptomyces sp. NPDC093260]